jgi:hypothetical protein
MALDGKPNGGFKPSLEIANSAIPTFPQVLLLFPLSSIKAMSTQSRKFLSPAN